MEEIIIDCSAIRTKEDLHRLFREALCFPDWYGNNLDALYDCMTEVQTDVTFHLKNMSALGRRGPALQILLQKAAVLNPHIHLEME